MMDRRSLVLTLTVLFGIAGVMLIDAPIVPRPGDRTGDPPVLEFDPADVRGLEITLGDDRFVIARSSAGWVVDGEAAGAMAATAIDALVDALVDLRPVDRFEDARDAPFGLGEPEGRLVVRTTDGETTLVLGGFNAARSAVYARRTGDPDVQIVGAYLLSVLERVFYAVRVAQRPEIG